MCLPELRKGSEAMSGSGKRDLAMLLLGAFIGWFATIITKAVGLC